MTTLWIHVKFPPMTKEKTLLGILLSMNGAMMLVRHGMKTKMETDIQKIWVHHVTGQIMIDP